MRILMLTPYLPYPPNSGGQTRSFNLIKNLSGKHEITLFSLIKDDEEKKYVNNLEKYCRKVRVFKRSKTPWTVRNILMTGFGLYPFLVIRNLVPEEKAALTEELKSNRYDLIHAETFYVMPHIPETDTPILLVDQTIEYLVYKHYVEEQAPFIARPLFSIDVAKLKYSETHFWKSADRVVAMSLSDKKEMVRLVPNLKVDIVPNGIDSNFFSAGKRQILENPRVLYVGNLRWLQNIEAIEVLIHTVWPLIKKEIPNATLWIVGNYITDEIKAYASEDIQITENIPDIRDAYLNSTVLVAPIEGPGGTRLKVLESMASGLPVITTTVGAEGLEIVNSKHALIENDYLKLAKLAVKVIKDKNLAKRLGDNSKRLVEERYSWDTSSSLLDKIYHEIAHG